MFYSKIINTLKNKNINFFKNINEVEIKNSFVFNSLSDNHYDKSNLWQHFSGFEIETDKDLFNDKIFNLMDFDYIKNSVHFFYTLHSQEEKR